MSSAWTGTRAEIRAGLESGGVLVDATLHEVVQGREDAYTGKAAQSETDHAIRTGPILPEIVAARAGAFRRETGEEATSLMSILPAEGITVTPKVGWGLTIGGVRHTITEVQTFGIDIVLAWQLQVEG